MDDNVTNHTNFLLHISETEALEWVITFLILCFTGTITNILMLIMLLRNRNLRSSCGILIIHCLIGHTILCTVIFPVNGHLVYKHHVLKQPDNGSYCGGFMWIQMTVRYAADWIETGISLNRMAALFFPFSYRRLATTKYMQITAISLWFLALIIATPGWYNIGVKYFLMPIGACSLQQFGVLGKLTFVYGYYLPMVIAGMSYILVYGKVILTKLWKGTSQDRKRLRMANTMFVGYIWTSLCYLLLPVSMGIMPRLFAENPMLLLWFAAVLVGGYVLLPVIFCAMNNEYRQGIMQLLTEKWTINPGARQRIAPTSDKVQTNSILTAHEHPHH